MLDGKIKVGAAGSDGLGYMKALQKAARMGLGCLEVAFTYGVRAHFSGIDYGPKGERRHLNTTPKFFRPLAEGLVGRKVEVTLINESPRPYQDAAMMKRVLEKLMAG